MMIEQSESLELDLKAEDSHGKTGYQWAKGRGKTDVVKLIQTKMPCLAEHRESPTRSVPTHSILRQDLNKKSKASELKSLKFTE